MPLCSDTVPWPLFQMAMIIVPVEDRAAGAMDASICSSMVPVSRPASAMIGLNVEPGANCA